MVQLFKIWNTRKSLNGTGEVSYLLNQKLRMDKEYQEKIEIQNTCRAMVVKSSQIISKNIINLTDMKSIQFLMVDKNIMIRNVQNFRIVDKFLHLAILK